MSVTRWEDDVTVWTGPHYGDRALRYADEVRAGYATGRLITCPEVVDWSGTGTRDLLLSSWDACYDGRVVLRRQVGTRGDGTPELGPEQRLDGVRGYVTAVADGEVFHLVSASRLRAQVYVFPNTGARGAPRFGEPAALELEADWVRGNEYVHLARFHDIDGDGIDELIVGTDVWHDYWPNGLEWNETGYRAYDAAGRWLGGPLRGYLYVFRNRGTLAAPVLERGRPVISGDSPLEVYGQLAPGFGDFDGRGASVVCGEFWNILHVARQTGPAAFAPAELLRTATGDPLELDHCVHIPCVVDWDGDGRPDVLVGAEDGYVTYLRNTGAGEDGRPVFENRGRVETAAPSVHGGALPSPAAHDFTGNGLPDLVVGNSAGELLFYENAGPRDAPRLAREVRLEAGGAPVRLAAGLTGSIQGPSEKRFGYACPTVADWDGDGLPDILVGDVTGHHFLFRNAGGAPALPPRFETPVRLTYRGRPLTTVWRVRPAVLDWSANGDLHYVCLDETGTLSDYRRIGDTELGDKRHLTWQDGTPITFTPDAGGGRGRVKLCAADWTGTGRHDLIVGTHARACLPPGPGGGPRHTTGQAGIFLLENVGSQAEPAFAPARPFRFRGEVIAMGMHVASPEVADWDGSGARGLLVGIEDGSIVWLPRDGLSV